VRKDDKHKEQSSLKFPINNERGDYTMERNKYKWCNNEVISIKCAGYGIAFLYSISLLMFGASVAAPVPGGSLDPTTIPKYVSPLVIPPEMPKSTTDMTVDYQIAVQQFQQQILPAGFPATTVWSYGSADDPASFNYPAFTVEASANLPTKVKWINNLKDAAGNFLPHLFAVDQTLHWANPTGVGCKDGTARTDCAGTNPLPYSGPVPIVTHVHGAHVGPESDGYPEAWWLPDALNIPAGYVSQGSNWGQAGGFLPVPGQAVFQYPNDQSETTLWYHDHSLGMTRLNVYAGPAGFWLVRDPAGQEVALNLPGPAPKIGDAPGVKYYEIPIVIQDRSFNADGSLFYPNNRAFFEGVNPNKLKIDFAPLSDISPIWNPEAFFNVMVVNGVAWPFQDVDQGRYRLRLLNGSNSRFLNLSLQVVDVAGVPTGQEIPFYQIGSDQGLLPDVVMVQTGTFTVYDDETGAIVSSQAPDPMQALLMAPAERADVIVDFTGLPAGTRVRMVNTAPDAPFGGFPDIPADPLTSGQVMEFVVGAVAGPVFVDPTNLPLNDVVSLVPDAPVREVSLNEEESLSVCVTVSPAGKIKQVSKVLPGPTFLADCTAAGGLPFAPKAAVLGTMAAGVSTPMLWSNPITESPALNSTEEWAINNLTVDSHPIHVHLVKFQVVGRGLPGGAVNPPLPNEQGWKDTVIAYPGEVTHIRATFDVPGLYVWHCHIVEHEDNEMMRPMCVGGNCPPI
jgi:FtsP/CotA-like multicopper oxidase with cupredoxin domain